MSSMRIIGLVILNAVITVALIHYLVPQSNTLRPLSSEQTTYKLNQAEQSVVDLVDQVNPAVLSIIVSQDVPVYEEYLRQFGPFGFVIPERREVGSELRQIGSGSGFIVSADGLVVTNRHVVSVEGAEYVGIDPEGSRYHLELIESDDILDIAILQIQDVPDDLPYLSFGNSDELRLGQSVVAIGNALGEFSNSVSVGVVSGLSRSIIAGSGFGQAELLENVIQTDAAINPGNSGGPLLNLGGKVVGVNVAIAAGSENIGFAIPSNLIVNIVESVVETGRIIRPYLGVRYVMINPEIAKEFELSVTKGALVFGSGVSFAVVPGSPADAAGIREGDVITQVGESAVNSELSLSAALRRQPIGEPLPITVVRGQETLSLSVILEEFDQ